MIEAPELTVAPGSSGSFDVLITSTGGTFNVASDIVELSLIGLSGVSFTGVSIDTVTPTSTAALGNDPGLDVYFQYISGHQFETFDFLFRRRRYHDRSRG